MEDCNGQCLEQTGNLRDWKRVKDCPQKCQLVECPNFLVCGNADPQFLLFCHGSKCVGCDMRFGNALQKIESTSECCVCMDKICKFKLTCGHEFCESCIRKMFFDSDPMPKKPKIYEIGEYESEDDESEEELTEEEEMRLEQEEIENSIKYGNLWENTCPLCRKEI